MALGSYPIAFKPIAGNKTTVASGVTGTVFYTNSNDILAANGTTAVKGTLSRVNANDTLVASGTTSVRGTLSTTNANDTSNANGNVGGGAISGTVAYTNNNDILSAAGRPVVNGSLTRVNANDTLNSNGTTAVKGLLATTNSNDTLSASGTVGSSSVYGTVNYLNNNDALAAFGIGAQLLTDTHDGYWAKKWLKKKKKPIELDEAIEFVQEEIAEVKAKQVIYKAKQPLTNTKPSAVNYSGLISGLERELVRLQQEIDDEDEEIALLTLM